MRTARSSARSPDAAQGHAEPDDANECALPAALSCISSRLLPSGAGHVPPAKLALSALLQLRCTWVPACHHSLVTARFCSHLAFPVLLWDHVHPCPAVLQGPGCAS